MTEAKRLTTILSFLSFKTIVIFSERERGDNGLFLALVPKSFQINVFLFVDFTTLGTSVNFDWLVY